MVWRNKKCDSCTFCIVGECRESPPSVWGKKYVNARTAYPEVVRGKNKACSKYQPKKKRKQNK